MFKLGDAGQEGEKSACTKTPSKYCVCQKIVCECSRVGEGAADKDEEDTEEEEIVKSAANGKEKEDGKENDDVIKQEEGTAEMKVAEKEEEKEEEGEEGEKSAEDVPEPKRCCVCSSTEDVKRCGGCKATIYCSKECQMAHHSYHAPYCCAISGLEKLELDKIYGDKSVQQKQLDGKVRRKMMELWVISRC